MPESVERAPTEAVLLGRASCLLCDQVWTYGHHAAEVVYIGDWIGEHLREFHRVRGDQSWAVMHRVVSMAPLGARH
jgi:hypothetical protein